MAFRLPDSLLTPEDDQAISYVQGYFGSTIGESNYFAGSAFDTWDSLKTRDQDQNRFTADDLVAVTFLSVDVPALAAQSILGSLSSTLSELLEQTGPDRDRVCCTDR